MHGPGEADRRRITIDLDLGGPAIAGELTGESGPATRFTGWLGLTEALEVALGRGRRPDAQPGSKDQGASVM